MPPILTCMDITENAWTYKNMKMHKLDIVSHMTCDYNSHVILKIIIEYQI